jgi:hypothetical protein
LVTPLFRAVKKYFRTSFRFVERELPRGPLDIAAVTFIYLLIQA